MKTSSNMVVEVCPHCENEIEMRWDTSTMGFRAFCPVCGNRLMLCDERYSLGVYHLLYPSDGSDLEECPYCEGRERPLYCRGYGKKEHEISPGVFLTSEELRQAYEKQEHIYDLQDIEEELDTFSEEYGLDEMPVTDTELEDMATDLRRRLDENADAIWSICRSEAIEKILKDRKEAPDADKARRSVVH